MLCLSAKKKTSLAAWQGLKTSHSHKPTCSQRRGQTNQDHRQSSAPHRTDYEQSLAKQRTRHIFNTKLQCVVQSVFKGCRTAACKLQQGRAGCWMSRPAPSALPGSPNGYTHKSEAHTCQAPFPALPSVLLFLSPSAKLFPTQSPALARL